MRYVDPTGRIILDADSSLYQQNSSDNLNNTDDSIYDYGCTLTSYARIAIALGANITLDEANQIAMDNDLFSNPNLLSVSNGVELVNKILENQGITDVNVSLETSFDEPGNITGAVQVYDTYNSKSAEFFVNARIKTTNSDYTKTFGHSVNIPSNATFGDACWGINKNIRINDTTWVKRDQILGDSAGRVNNILRLDIIRVNRVNGADCNE